MKKKSLVAAFLSVLIFSSVMLNTVSASPRAPIFQKINEENLEIDIVEIEGPDVNHTELIEKMNQYVENNAEKGTFSSLHIDREEDPSGIVVFSFTKEPTEQLKEGLKAIANEELELKFRLVSYTEQELMEKQGEIYHALFEDKVLEEHGIQVYHTGVNVINNKLEIGIAPFNEENIRLARNYFSDDMIDIVEGMEFQLLTDMEKKETSDEREERKPNIFKRLFQWLGNLFSS